MNGDIDVQTICKENKNGKKISVAFILYGREVTQHKSFWYLYLKGKDHLGQLVANGRLRVRRFGVRTPWQRHFPHPSRPSPRPILSRE
jgi:hypothetical protein